MGIKEDFLKRTKMVDVHNGKNGVEEVMDYLVNPTIIDKMIIASEMDLPVLTLIAKDLENKFDKNSNFPVVVTDLNKNALGRQNVGRMIKFIMAQYGYTPIDGGLSERARIPAVSGSEYFSTSGIYKKTEENIYQIEIISKKI
ncbi:hypothetical protein G9F71_012535 [Clostridium sp. FP2]|uniref:hypothetical protein n=1 Tax=Clostridium sp. FP2 TaxID=2724481 RepID=UPI0013E98F74|nr:hypothetical protein [Clostridium sp. FP2]MBZ9623677.1 hypothetical protein [Clostridium sp. FP2]